MSLWQTFFFAAVFFGGLLAHGTGNWSGLTTLTILMSTLALVSTLVERK